MLAVKEIDDTATMPDQPHLAESLTEALKQLKEGSNLLEEQFQGDDLGGMFGNLGLDDVCFKLLFSLIYLSPFLIELINCPFSLIRKMARIHFYL